MAVATKPTVIDGVSYGIGQTLPDFGSIVVTARSADGSVRRYEGLSADFDKLPTYCASGSVFFELNTGATYRFHKPTKKWYHFNSAGASELPDATLLGVMED